MVVGFAPSRRIQSQCTVSRDGRVMFKSSVSRSVLHGWAV